MRILSASCDIGIYKARQATVTPWQINYRADIIASDKAYLLVITGFLIYSRSG